MPYVLSENCIHIIYIVSVCVWDFGVGFASRFVMVSFHSSNSRGSADSVFGESSGLFLFLDFMGFPLIWAVCWKLSPKLDEPNPRSYFELPFISPWEKLAELLKKKKKLFLTWLYPTWAPRWAGGVLRLIN